MGVGADYVEDLDMAEVVISAGETGEKGNELVN